MIKRLRWHQKNVGGNIRQLAHFLLIPLWNCLHLIEL